MVLTTGEPAGWPEPEEGRAWINLVKVLLVLPGALESQLLRDSDLTLLGYMILSRLAAIPGETLRMSEVAEMANGSLPRISHAVTRLEDRGWVERRVQTGRGRRFTLVSLTETGRAHVEAAAPDHVATIRRLAVEPLGDDFLAVCTAAARIVETLGLPT
ncbi:MarR family transcriptional regulator [Amycolatopsis sp. PS_44_ISF1]|uniref:MarR family winged helix-turn-helix transcriptional regulator n=1 Tax=Amycolatopsis sp. PS_44_ISF1 TaxID=2974917 RepID=UPI0028DD5F85|nr:MarR family transcriptional regulator [Amycolatopsis sp. PS_44_ISF1]MDT8914483.1 MarR family transcriptional regulator [Amycolatopsis sp. PS_44_ISF1]